MGTEPIYLSLADFNQLEAHIIGQGTDGAVYKRNQKELIKIYHSNFYRIMSAMEGINKDEDIKIYKKGTIITKPNLAFTAYASNNTGDEQLRLPVREAVRYAISCQKNITMTKLPKNIVYMDKIFAGILLDKVNGIQIHKLIGLPLNLKKKIMLKIIKKVVELLDNNIYHIDLNNSPFSSKSIYIDRDGIPNSVGHSHVLVDHKFEPHLIDLDGKSTIYTEKYSKEYEDLCLQGLCQLLIEFLLEIDLDEIENSGEIKLDEIDDLGMYTINGISLFEINQEEEKRAIFLDSLERAKVKTEYIEALSEYKLNIEQIEDVVKTLTR